MAAASPTSGREPKPAVDFKILGISLGSIAGVMLLIVGIAFTVKCIRKRQLKDLDSSSDRETIASPMAIVMNAVTSPTQPPRAAARHIPNVSVASTGRTTLSKKQKGSISHPPPHITTDAFSQKNFKHFPISRPIPQVGSAPMPQATIPIATNFTRPQRPPITATSATAHTASSSVLRPPRPSVVGSAVPALQPRQPSQVGSNGPDVQDGARRSSGWNRYWSGGSALNMMGFNNKRATYNSQQTQQTQQTDQESLYSADSRGNRVVSDHPEFIPPPLNYASNATRMSQVRSGSPTVSHRSRGFPLPTGRVGHIHRTDSVSSLSSYGDDPRDQFSSGVPTSEPEQPQGWTPFAGSDWNGNRGTSSVYTDENYLHTPQRATLVDSYYQTSNLHPYQLPAQALDREPEPMRDDYGQSHIYPTASEARVTAQRRMDDGSQYRYPSSSTSRAGLSVRSDDMSWLNLGVPRQC